MLVGDGETYRVVLVNSLNLKTIGDIADVTDHDLSGLQERIITEQLASSRLNLRKLREQ